MALRDRISRFGAFLDGTRSTRPTAGSTDDSKLPADVIATRNAVVDVATDLDRVDDVLVAATGSATPLTLVKRSSAGAASFSSVLINAAPSAATHATRKDYVDGLIAALEARLAVLDGGSNGGGSTPPPVTPPIDTSLPQQLGPSMTALPSWTDSTEVVTSGVRAAPGDIPIWTAQRTYVLPNLPNSGRDITAALNAAWAAASDLDEITIPAGTWSFSNITRPAQTKRIRLRGGTASLNAPARLVSTSETQHAFRVLGAGGFHLFGASKTARLEIVVDNVAGRGDKNQQGMTCLLLDSSDQTGNTSASGWSANSGFRGQDLLLEGSRAAGFFAYNFTTDFWLNRVEFKGTLADASHVTGGCSYGVFTDCLSIDHGDDGRAFVHYQGRDAVERQSHHMQVYRDTILANAHGRGLANIACRDIVADQVRVVASAAAGVIIDTAETYGTDHPKVASTGNHYRRLELLACDWGEPDHGSLLLRAGASPGLIGSTVIEQVKVVDAKGNRSAVRAFGGSAPTARLTDFVFAGGKSSTPTLGPVQTNGIENITKERWDETAASTSAAPTIPPAIVFETPSRAAVLKGTLSGFPCFDSTRSPQEYVGVDEAKWAPTRTHLQSNAQVFQGKAGATRGLAKVEVYLDSTLLHTQTSFDAFGSWKTPPVDTTAYADGSHEVRAVATMTSGLVTTSRRAVVVRNAVATIPTPTPTGGRPSTSQSVLFDVDAVESGTVGQSAPGLYDTLGLRHFVQDDLSLQPLVAAGPKSGQKAVKLDGGYLRMATSGITGQRRVTFSLVMRVDGASSANRPGVLSAAAHAADDWQNATGAFNFTAPRLSSATTWDSSTIGGSVVSASDPTVTVDPAVPFGKWVLVELEVGTDGANSKLWVDGVLVADLTGRAGANSLALALGNLVLGSRTYSNGYSDRSRVSITRALAHAGARVTSTLAWAQSTYGVAAGATAPTTPPADTTAPTAPTGVTATRSSDTAGSVTWAAATDDTAVTGYRVARTSRTSGNVVTVDITSGRTVSWTDLTAGHVYDVTVRAFDAAGNLSTAGTVPLPAFTATPAGPAASPSTTATMLMHVDPSTSAVGDAARMTDLTDRVTGKVFAWPTDAERPIVRTLPSGRKVAEFLNGRALLEGSGIPGQAAMTVTMVIAQRNLVTALRSGYVSGAPAGVNDYDKAAGQWNIGGPSATGETAWSSLTVGGAPGAGSGGTGSAAFTGFSRALDTYAVVQVAMSMDGTAPAVWVDGVALTTSATNPTTSGTLALDRILLGARWYDGGPKDGQQDRLAAFFVHAGRLSTADRNAVRSWAAETIGTPTV